jgi:predicted DNA-binding transcriptional regulator YafY
MLYQHTLEIHERLENVLRLIRSGRYSTPALAKEVGVSIPTISRIVAALREQGHEIRAERTEGGWRYLLSDDEMSAGHGKRSRSAEKGRGSGHHD